MIQNRGGKALQEKGILRQECGYWVLRQSMPYPLAENNVYLFEADEGWIVLDVGVDLPDTRRLWELALLELGIGFKQIKNILISHCHPDHLGAAAWLQRMSDAPVSMLEAELHRARRFVFLPEPTETAYREAIHEEADRQGFSKPLQNQLIKDWCENVLPLFPAPSDIQTLREHDSLCIGGCQFEILGVPAHTEGQMALYCAQRRHLFIADVLTTSGYLHFTDWPHVFRDNPLQASLDMLEKLQNLNIERTFPGHGPSIQDLEGAIAKLKRRHLRQCDRMTDLASKQNRPFRAGDIYSQFEPATQSIAYIHLHRVALGETLGYMQYLGL